MTEDDTDASQDRIDELGERIEQARSRLEEQEDHSGEQEEDPAFVQTGEADEDEPVDDTIAPPG